MSLNPYFSICYAEYQILITIFEGWVKYVYLSEKMSGVNHYLLINQFCKLFAFVLLFASAIGCDNESPYLTVYAGKGLKKAMEEVKTEFKKDHGIPIYIVYAGSDTLLKTLKKTLKGDIFIPGSLSYIEKAGDLVNSHDYIAQHVPAFAAISNSSINLHEYNDLLHENIRIAIGNKSMCAIGRIGEKILDDLAPEDSFRKNIIITASTVNELLKLLNEGKVDAALIWNDMLLWEEAENLTRIEIPDEFNRPKEIHVGILSTTVSPKKAQLFADFMTTKGRDIFLKQGFGNKCESNPNC